MSKLIMGVDLAKGPDKTAITILYQGSKGVLYLPSAIDKCKLFFDKYGPKVSQPPKDPFNRKLRKW